MPTSEIAEQTRMVVGGTDLSGGGVAASLPASQRGGRALSFDADPVARALQLMALREVGGARRREHASITLASTWVGVREAHQSDCEGVYF
jgi:hypothetical protein